MEKHSPAALSCSVLFSPASFLPVSPPSVPVSLSFHTNLSVSFPVWSCTPITKQQKSYLPNIWVNMVCWSRLYFQSVILISLWLKVFAKYSQIFSFLSKYQHLCSIYIQKYFNIFSFHDRLSLLIDTYSAGSSHIQVFCFELTDIIFSPKFKF